MSLLFGGATSDRVNCGSGSTLDDILTGTILAWAYPTDVGTGGKYVLAKPYETGATGGLSFEIGVGSSGDILVKRRRATTNLLASSNGGYVTTNTWQLLGTSWNSSGTATDQRLYRGLLTADATECSSYAPGQSAGTGANQSDAAKDLYIGNGSSDAATWTHAFVGSIAWVGVWNRQLTLGEIIAQQYRPRKTSGCVLFMHLGFNGVGTQYDLSGSGNHGTVTGATQASHVPVAM